MTVLALETCRVPVMADLSCHLPVTDYTDIQTLVRYVDALEYCQRHIEGHVLSDRYPLQLVKHQGNVFKYPHAEHKTSNRIPNCLQLLHLTVHDAVLQTVTVIKPMNQCLHEFWDARRADDAKLS